MSDPNTPEQVMAEHVVSDDQPNWPEPGHCWVMCACGESWQGEDAKERYATHVLAALREAGYEVVKLPEPGEFSPDGAHWNDYPFVTQKGTDVAIGARSEYVYRINSTEARNVAAALLAAARAAEEQGDQS